jgi:pectin methylesterase-like acyl-CoA thioesterase
VKRVLAVVIAAAALVGTLSACSSPDLPAKSTDPVALTKVYLAAAKSKKCDVTKALTRSSTWAWCENPTLLSYTVADKAEVVPFNPGGTKETCVSTTVTSKASGEQEMMNGERDWNFCYTKTGDGWRLTDQGQG